MPTHRVLQMLATLVMAAGSVMRCADAATPAATQTTVSGSTLNWTPPRAELRAQVGPQLKVPGTLNVGMAVGYSPFEFFEEGAMNIQGVDAELARAVGEVLGLRVNLMNIPYDSLGPSLKTRRIDVIWSGEGDTRLKEANFDYVDYVDNKLAILVRKGNPKGIHGLLDLCGRSVATGKTSATFIAYIEKTSQDCSSHGKPPVQMLQFGSSNDVDLAVRSGRADAAFNAYAQALVINALPNAGSELAAPPLPLTPIGVAVPKHSAIAGIIRDALSQVVASGRYEQILRKYQIWDCCRLPSISLNAAAM